MNIAEAKALLANYLTPERQKDFDDLIDAVFTAGRHDALETAEAVHEAVESASDRRVQNSADVMALLLLHKILLINSQAKGRKPKKISITLDMKTASEVIDGWQLTKQSAGDHIIFTVQPRG